MYAQYYKLCIAILNCKWTATEQWLCSFLNTENLQIWSKSCSQYSAKTTANPLLWITRFCLQVVFCSSLNNTERKDKFYKLPVFYTFHICFNTIAILQHSCSFPVTDSNLWPKLQVTDILYILLFGKIPSSLLMFGMDVVQKSKKSIWRWNRNYLCEGNWSIVG